MVGRMGLPGKERILVLVLAVLFLLAVPLPARVQSAGAVAEEEECPTPTDNPESVGGSWNSAAPLRNPRAGLAAVADNSGHIYAIGGEDENNGFEPQGVEVYDGKQWEPMPDFDPPTFTPRAYLGAAKDEHGRIYAIGGGAFKKDPLSGAPELQIYDTVEMFDPGNLTAGWVEMAPMPTARMNLAVAHYDGKIYAFGGATRPYDKVLSGAPVDPPSPDSVILFRR